MFSFPKLFPFHTVAVSVAVAVASASAAAGLALVASAGKPSPDAPLVLRAHLPNPIEDFTVFAARGSEKKPASLPAAIAVSFGPSLAVCFDTVECRFLYAWKNGFLDNLDAPRPAIQGDLVYLARGPHPVSVTAGAFGAPRFRALQLVDNLPQFSYTFGRLQITETLRPSPDGNSILHEIAIGNSPGNPAIQLPGEFLSRIAPSSGKLTGNLLTLENASPASVTLTIDISGPPSLTRTAPSRSDSESPAPPPAP